MRPGRPARRSTPSRPAVAPWRPATQCEPMPRTELPASLCRFVARAAEARSGLAPPAHGGPGDDHYCGGT